MRPQQLRALTSLILRQTPPAPPRLENIQPHLDAALAWIERARRAAPGGGIAKGYDLLRDRWSPAYPETTGYTIPTLLNTARFLNRRDLEQTALELARFLLHEFTRQGGIIHWEATTGGEPMVFDTGQVIFGWLAAHRHTDEPAYLNAARRGADWIVSVQDASGCWRTGQYKGVVKTIDTRVAWALLELHVITGEVAYREAAMRNLEWALANQHEDGWFAQCAFLPAEDPYTHTLAYTAEGLLECSRILAEQKYTHAAQKLTDALLACQRWDGSLASTYAAGWHPTNQSSCLTGNCQMARLWLLLHRQTRQPQYLDAAEKVLAFVAQTQPLACGLADIRGAIFGSHPIHGSYERFKAPNWAAKFFIDGLLALEEARTGQNLLMYPG